MEYPADIQQFSVKLSLDGMEKYKTTTISRITIYQDQVPVGIKKLSLILEDTDLFNLPHGMHLIDFNDVDIVLEDNFKIMPLSPPPGKPHKYRLTVRAFDENHVLLSRAV